MVEGLRGGGGSLTPPPPLLPLPQGALVSRAAILKQQLRQGALSVRRGRGLRDLGVGPGPEVPPLTPPPELTAQLRLVSTSCQERIRAWPRLLDLLDQW